MSVHGLHPCNALACCHPQGWVSSTSLQAEEAGSAVGTLMRMPWEAATPVPTMTAVGVASPRAQGQAITSTAMPNSSANRKWLWPAGSHSGGYSPCMPARYLHQKRMQLLHILQMPLHAWCVHRRIAG